MFRQGDVLIQTTKSIPKSAAKLPHTILAHGEVTGHSHRIEAGDDVELFEDGGTLYLRVVGREATVVHQEHGPIKIPYGEYKVWRQREYSPKEIRIIRD
jgi:hypothetical protein